MSNSKKQNCWYVMLKLNARLMPLDRGNIIEEPLDYALRKMNIGEVTGGGTYQSATGEINSCDIEICLYEKNKHYYTKLKEFLLFLGLPKQSLLSWGHEHQQIGNLDGLALYLNGTDLDEGVYKSCDVNYLISKLIQLLDNELKYYSYWEGSKETALYFYGKSFYKMKERIFPFISTYPLCKKSKVIQIA